MLTYKEIENLPPDHPKVKQFIQEVEENDIIFATVMQDYFHSMNDEESLDYFNRYIAGDR